MTIVSPRSNHENAPRDTKGYLPCSASLTGYWVLAAVASLLFFAWIRIPILAGGIAVVLSSVDHVEDGHEVLDLILWRLGYRPERVERKKWRCRFILLRFG